MCFLYILTKRETRSNRCHTRTERELTWPFLEALVGMLKPRRLVAIGGDAAKALAEVKIPVSTVRHPSYGGQAEFIAGIEKIYGISVSRDLRTNAESELPMTYAGSTANAA